MKKLLVIIVLTILIISIILFKYLFTPKIKIIDPKLSIIEIESISISEQATFNNIILDHSQYNQIIESMKNLILVNASKSDEQVVGTEYTLKIILNSNENLTFFFIDDRVTVDGETYIMNNKSAKELFQIYFLNSNSN